MKISVASGKGGTGKTTVSASLAFSLAENEDVQLLDCDVEEPNAHIFIKPEIKERKTVYIKVPEVDETVCDFCGVCQKVCAYKSVAVLKPSGEREGKVLVFPELCHGCGACSYLCPKGCIKEVDRPVGVIERGVRGRIDFVHGKLNIGEAMAPPVIREVKNMTAEDKTVIIDAPPGTSCPVISSIKGTDFCLLVTEPTPFGLNDLVLAVEVLRKMEIPFGVFINRSDLGNEDTEKYCSKENISVLMKMPFRKEIAMAYSKGIPIVEAFREYKNGFLNMIGAVKEKLRG